MAKDFVINITESQVGQWVAFSVPASSTSFPCFEVGQLGGAIKISYSPDGANAKPLLLNGIVPEGVTLYCMANSPASAVLNDFFFRNKVIVSKGGGGGGGGGTSYTFSLPLRDNNTNVVLDIENDLQVVGGKLTLDLNNNTDFSQLADLVSSLTSGVEIIGKIPNTNVEVTANTTLITNYVQQEKSRAPRGGDVVLTTEANSPSFVWIFTSNGAWSGLGTTGAGIATNTTVGLIKGSSTLNIASDGTANVQNVLQLTGDYTVQGNITYNNPIYISRRIRFTATDSASIAPNSNVRAQLYFEDSSIGVDCAYDLQLNNNTRILQLPAPQTDTEPVRKIDLDRKITLLPAGTTPTTQNVLQGQIAFVLRS